MARNRRNKRSSKSTGKYMNVKAFIITIGVLLTIILICLGVNKYRINLDKQQLAKEKEELDKLNEQIFIEIEDNIEQANRNISEQDIIIKMSTVGDILCGEAMVKDAYHVETNSYNFSHMFNRVSGYINKADIVMGTMETCFTSGDYTNENSPVEFARAVKNSGVNLVTICHNHSLDYGIEGLENTKTTLENLGYDVFGDKLDDENAVMIKTVKGVNIAFLTYTYGVNRQASKSEEEMRLINLYSEEQVKKDIEYAKEKEAEYICVLIHWGDAISSKVNQEQKDIASFLVDNGVDMILGAHPSVVQPMEIRKNSEGKNVFIAYSIGTYISTLTDDNAKVELVLNVELRKSGKDDEVYLSKVDYTPIYVLDNGEEAEKRYELVDMKSVASSYTQGNTGNISRNTYNKMIKGLRNLNKMLDIN